MGSVDGGARTTEKEVAMTKEFSECGFCHGTGVLKLVDANQNPRHQRCGCCKGTGRCAHWWNEYGSCTYCGLDKVKLVKRPWWMDKDGNRKQWYIRKPNKWSKWKRLMRWYPDHQGYFMQGDFESVEACYEWIRLAEEDEEER